MQNDNRLFYCYSNKLNDFLKIFNIDSLDWDYIINKSEGNWMKKVCTYYNEHPKIKIKEVAEVFQVNRNTISKALQRGTELGLCNYFVKH